MANFISERFTIEPGTMNQVRVTKGTTWFQAPKMAKKIDFFCWKESPQTVLQLIPKHWGSAANRNQRGWGGGK